MSLDIEMQDFELLSDSSGICNVRSIVDRSRRTQLSVTSDYDDDNNCEAENKSFFQKKLWVV